MTKQAAIQENPMRKIRVEKLTVNIGTSKEQSKLDKGLKLIKHLTAREGVKTVSKKRIPSWGIRPGLPIGCKLTIRDSTKYDLIKKLLKAKENVLNKKNFGQNGTVAFGIHEYIDIPDVKYEPDIGIMGFQACITLERPGYNIKKRRLHTAKISKKHQITKEEAISYIKSQFGTKIEGD